MPASNVRVTRHHGHGVMQPCLSALCSVRREEVNRISAASMIRSCKEEHVKEPGNLRVLCHVSVGLSLSIDGNISACQYQIYYLGSAKPTGQLCHLFLLASLETRVVLLVTSKMHS